VDLPGVVVVQHRQEDGEGAELRALEVVAHRPAVVYHLGRVRPYLRRPIGVVGVDALGEGLGPLLDRRQQQPEELVGLDRADVDVGQLLYLLAELDLTLHVRPLVLQRVDLRREDELGDREHERDAGDDGDDDGAEHGAEGAPGDDGVDGARADDRQQDEQRNPEHGEASDDQPAVGRDEEPDFSWLSPARSRIVSAGRSTTPIRSCHYGRRFGWDGFNWTVVPGSHQILDGGRQRTARSGVENEVAPREILIRLRFGSDGRGVQ